MPILTLPGSFALHASAALAEFLHNRFRKGERTPYNKSVPSCNGIEATAVLNQLHYWIESGYGVVHEDERWIYNTQQEWLQQFPGMSKYRFSQIVKWLKANKFIKTSRLRASSDRDQTTYYAINYDALSKIGVQWQDEKNLTPKSETRLVQESKIEHCKDQISNDDLYTKNTYKEYVNSAIKSERIAEAIGEENLNQEEEVAIAIPQDEERTANPPLSLDDVDQLDTEQANELLDPETPQFRATPLAPCDSKPKLLKKQNPRFLKWKLEAIASLIPVNESITKAAENVSEWELEQALTLYKIEDDKCVVANPQGWLVACLKQRWWEENDTEVKEQIEWDIEEKMSEFGKTIASPDFWDKYWYLVENNIIEPMSDDSCVAHRIRLSHEKGSAFVIHNGQWVHLPVAFETLVR